jgi:cytidine deaminase
MLILDKRGCTPTLRTDRITTRVRTKERAPKMKDSELIDRAKKAREGAYAPYSKFKVGAALLAKSGKVYTGANVENATFGLTVCAERVALFKAVTKGEKHFVKIAVVADRDEPITPCGACRQVLSEFASDLQIVCANLKGKTERYNLKKLLPEAFEKFKKNFPTD